MNKSDLRLHEQILLLALRNEKGTMESRAGSYRLALGGALLSELVLEGCVSITDDKKKLVNADKVKRFDDGVLDEALTRIEEASRRRSAARWVNSLAGMKRLRHRVAERLSDRGILKDDEDQILLLFKRKIYPTIDERPERRLVETLRNAIFTDVDEVEPRTAILVALADATGLLNVPFSKKELKPRKERLKEFAEGRLAAAATRDAVQAAQAAVMAAIVASTVVTTSH